MYILHIDIWFRHIFDPCLAYVTTNLCLKFHVNCTVEVEFIREYLTVAFNQLSCYISFDYSNSAGRRTQHKIETVTVYLVIYPRTHTQETKQDKVEVTTVSRRGMEQKGIEREKQRERKR